MTRILLVLLLVTLFASPTACFHAVLHLRSLCATSTSSSDAICANPNSIMTPDHCDRLGVTPNQIKALRKEASRRQARNIMVMHQYNHDDPQQSYASICADFEEHEMVQVRGISLDDKKFVASIAEQLSDDLSDILMRAVTIVQIQGHAVTLYAPTADISKRKIILRTSFQEGQLTYRQKPPRDHRGQIVADEEE